MWQVLQRGGFDHRKYFKAFLPTSLSLCLLQTARKEPWRLQAFIIFGLKHLLTPQKREHVLLFITPCWEGGMIFTSLFTEAWLICVYVVYHCIQIVSAHFCLYHHSGMPCWTSVNVKELCFGLKSSSFNMMENTFTVAVRCNICPVCKSVYLLPSDPCQLHKTLLRQPRYVFVQISFL